MTCHLTSYKRTQLWIIKWYTTIFLLSHRNVKMLTSSSPSLVAVVPPHLQVVQEPGEVQAPISSIPVVVWPDVFEASISKHAIVVL